MYKVNRSDWKRKRKKKRIFQPEVTSSVLQCLWYAYRSSFSKLLRTNVYRTHIKTRECTTDRLFIWSGIYKLITDKFTEKFQYFVISCHRFEAILDISSFVYKTWPTKWESTWNLAAKRVSSQSNSKMYVSRKNASFMVVNILQMKKWKHHEKIKLFPPSRHISAHLWFLYRAIVTQWCSQNRRN